MFGMLLAYDDAGNIVSTLDHLVIYDETKPERPPLGLVDFASFEAAGGELTEIWNVDTHDPARPVKGSKVWPEWLGGRALEFRVELVGPPGRKRIGALVHKQSGYRRERATVDAAIETRIAAAKGKPADISDLVGGPERPIHMDADGRSAPPPAPSPRPSLPLVSVDVP